MVIGIYNPYHGNPGGGEQYMFSIASYFLPRNIVKYFTTDPSELTVAQERFHLDLTKLQTIPTDFAHASLLEKHALTSSFDLFFIYSDGSIPFSFAKKNVIIFQFPVPWVKNTSLIHKAKFSRITSVLVNSGFTKKSIDTTFRIQSNVLYPAIQTEEYTVGKKEPLILSVGRFTKGMNTKRQDILISAFKKLVDGGQKKLKLVLAGGVLPQDKDLTNELRNQIGSYQIEILENIERQRLRDLYAQASFYWHAAGYGVNEEHHPEHVEHFGITTVEAMASGAIPLVYAAGGQKEIVQHQESGYIWKTIDELCAYTNNLCNNIDEKKRIQEKAITRAKTFDRSAFYSRLQQLFPGI